jgi:Phage integrase family.
MAKYRSTRRLNEAGKKKAPVLSPRDFKRLLYVAGQTRNPERNQLVVWLLFGAAFRITETAVIEIKDVLWKSGEIRNQVIIPGKYCKNGKAGHVFFYHKKLLAALDKYLNLRVEKRLLVVDSTDYRGLRKDSKVILSDYGKPYSLKRKLRKKTDGTMAESWACDTLQAAVTRWGRDAGIVGFTTHSGRRTFATRLSRRGANEDLLSALLRHTDTAQTYEYVDMDYTGLRKTLQALYALPKDEIEKD